MKKLFAALFFILVFSSAIFSQQTGSAPKMSVTSFALAENDNTANLSGTIVRDQNGDPCALIRVQTTQTGFAWDFGQMQPLKVEQKTGEIWIYVPYGVKRVTIRHPKYESISYDFPIPIQKARTYNMRLSATGFTIIVDQEVTQQYLIFNLTPKDAIVELDGQILETVDGRAMKLVTFGEHNYTVFSDNHHTVEGNVAVNDPENKKIVDIVLKPSFGTINFKMAALDGVSIFIDGKKIDNSSVVKGVAVASGNHNLKIVKPNYKIYTQEFLVGDGQTYTLSPVLQPNFKEVSISTLKGAEIYANDKLLGESPWKGNLPFDTYSFEIKKAGHKSVFQTLVFDVDSPSSFVLPEPIPLYGSIDINCKQLADVRIDGAAVGQTPLFLPKTLVGEHVIELSSSGFEPVVRKVTIEEGKTEIVSAELSLQTVTTPAPKIISTPAGTVPGDNEYVDLGLSVKWATCNLGASKPEEYGGYYQWAGTKDVTSTSIYLDWSNCPYHTGSSYYSGWKKYIPSGESFYWSGSGNPDNKMVLNPKDDVAHVKLGGKWRIPTRAEWEELRNTSNCSWTWTSINGINGYKVRSKKPGFRINWIFLPAAGCRHDYHLNYVGSNGCYWSSSLYTDHPDNAYGVSFGSDNVGTSYYYRYDGRSVRPVSE